MTERTNRPVLDAHRSDDATQLRVWCDHCRRDHWHGRHNPASGCTAYDNRRHQFTAPCSCPVGTGDGHRVAHCHNPASPYTDSGYVLREVTE